MGFGILKTVRHPLLSHPVISLGLTALTLLLLVLVLLSVPGPIKGLYWFALEDEDGQAMRAGVLGWCMTHTTNCTYAPLSDNPYLSTMIDTGEALVVRTMLPLACYWMIVTFLLWVGLTMIAPIGYKIKDLDSITRHLRFAIVESCVLCMSVFGNVLCWLAFGLGRTAFRSVERGGGKPQTGQAMETTAVAALLSLLSLFTAIWGLHLRLSAAQVQWKEEAVMLRRRSMALCASGVVGPDDDASTTLGRKESFLSYDRNGGLEKRWSTASTAVPDMTYGHGNGAGAGALQHGGSLVKAGYQPYGDPVVQSHGDASKRDNEEEHLDVQLEHAQRNSRDMVRRVSLHDPPYTAAPAAAGISTAHLPPQ